MKKFALKYFVFFALIGLFVFTALPMFLKGWVDEYYIHFLRSGKSLVIGSSRAAQGLSSEEISKGYGKNFDMENFGFGAAVSSYGPVYFDAIKEKVAASNEQELFILEVNPWTITCEKNNVNDDEAMFPEASGFIAKQWLYNSNPNLEFILRNKTPLYPFFINRNKGNEVFSSDEHSRLVGNVPMDSISVKNRLLASNDRFEKQCNDSKFSAKRMKYLNETVKYLSSKGKVVLVRMPIDPSVLVIENKLLHNFNELMQSVAAANKALYLNYSDSTSMAITTDGTHLFNDAAKKFSLRLGADIKSKL
ncbi:MAG: hypothetical protein ACO3EE_01160 [Flavobacteriales bacterium]